MSLDSISPQGQVAPHGPNGKCECRPERLAAQYNIQLRSPETIFRHAKVLDKSDPYYLDSETIAHVIWYWNSIGLSKPLDVLWNILMSREKSRITGMLSGLRISKDNKSEIVHQIQIDIFRCIVKGDYMWKCRFYYALSMRIKTASKKYVAAIGPDELKCVDDLGAIADGWHVEGSARDFKGVETRDWLDAVYYPHMNDDQILVIGLLAQQFSYQEVAGYMSISLRECTALIKQLHDKAHRIRKADDKGAKQ